MTLGLKYRPEIRIFEVNNGECYIPFTEKELKEYVHWHPVLLTQMETAKENTGKFMPFGHIVLTEPEMELKQCAT